MLRPRSIPAACAAFLSFAFFAHSLFAQSTTAPADPKALILAAASSNAASDSKPWHAKISFTINDWYGKPAQQGTIEEFWAAPDKIKLIYATSAFNQVEYTTSAGIRRTGTRDGAPPELTRVGDEFFRPIEIDAASVDTVQLKMQPLKSPNSKLTCVVASRPGSANSEGMNETYCIDQNLPILRFVISGNGFRSTVRNNIVRFQNHYFPQDVAENWGPPGDKNVTPHLVAKLERIEVIEPLDQADFVPPADALAPPQVVELDEKTTKAQLLDKPAPVYPPIAKAARVSGNVVLSLQIQTDGSVARIRVLSGPAMLQQAAMDGVGKWKFKPFTDKNQPVEVNTTVSVPFALMP